ncbi:CoF synthetase [uncultured Algibacter sp.]|uniref:CoF synthetase n=1 Tax=uncultured Algibacter sp. TaxID=298659 RepID=UPI002628075E|nr:CoF synthetase [uncultured Algibacter sp.]
MTKLLEIIRYHSFWVIDFFKGSKVKSHYKQIKFVLENYHSDKSIEKRNQYLNNLLSHAKHNVPFYESYKGSKSISDFPIVNKLILRESMNQFISENYRAKDSFEVSTSGSTGTPFLVLQDKNKKHRNTADTLYFGEKSGYRIGQKLFYIRAWGNLLTKSRLASFLQNIITINVKNLDTSSIPQIINKIEAGSSNKAFIGYPSAFREICKYLDSINAKPFKANITSIIANAEPLSEKTKKTIKKYFGIDALSRYSNMENGILSQQIKNEGEYFHINWASYYIEILDINEDVPVKYGDIGRVVVTDLFNFHMPLIRYDTGDLAVMNIDKNSFNGAPSFFKVEGRRMDTIYDTQGRIMTTVVYELEYFPEFKQFQFIQEGEKKYRVKINIDGVFKREQEMINLLKSYLGDNAEIQVEYVDEIPQLSSGKRKLTLNKYKT